MTDLAALLPEDIDLSYVAIFAAIGAVIGSGAARIARRRGRLADVHDWALEGGFWGGVIGLFVVLVATVAEVP